MVIGREKEKYIGHLVKKFKRDIKTLNDLTKNEIETATIEMNSLVEKHTKKLAKEAEKQSEVTNENA